MQKVVLGRANEMKNRSYAVLFANNDKPLIDKGEKNEASFDRK